MSAQCSMCKRIYKHFFSSVVCLQEKRRYQLGHIRTHNHYALSRKVNKFQYMQICCVVRFHVDLVDVSWCSCLTTKTNAAVVCLVTCNALIRQWIECLLQVYRWNMCFNMTSIICICYIYIFFGYKENAVYVSLLFALFQFIFCSIFV